MKKRNLLYLGLFWLVSLSLSSLPTNAKKRGSMERPGWELVWHDEFNGKQLSDEWTRIPRFPNPPEWNKYMSMDDRLFKVKGGKLILYGLVNDYLPQDTARFLTRCVPVFLCVKGLGLLSGCLATSGIGLRTVR